MSQLQPVRSLEQSSTEQRDAEALLAGLQEAKHNPKDKEGVICGTASNAATGAGHLVQEDESLDMEEDVNATQGKTLGSNAEGEEKRHTPITIGEALEATAITAGSKLVERSDAAAIQAAEVRATGRTNITPGGLAATAQAAAQLNARTDNPDEKITLADILTDASSKLPKDKAATRQDAEGVMSAELRNNPDICTHPTGVAASVVAAARLNQYAAMPAKDS